MNTSRRAFLKASSAIAASVGLDISGLHAAQSPRVASGGSCEFVYSHLDVLGTSLDLTVIAPDESAADGAERAVLDEVERLRRILSIYDPACELARINAAPPGTSMQASAELLEVLWQYDRWRQRTAGVFHGQLGNLMALWRQAERENRLPSADVLTSVLGQLATPGWRVDESLGTVQRLTEQTINVDALGKAYIIDKAVAAARRNVPALVGILLDIGGDIRVWGAAALKAPALWRVGVQDPAHKAENAAPLTILSLGDHAVASSASYERYYTIDGTRYSHILDPRAGMPTTGVSATVVAGDNATANALATSLCAMSPAEGLRLVESTPGAECLVITADGQQLRSEGFSLLETPAQAKESPAGDAMQDAGLIFVAAEATWPAGYQVTIDIDIKKRGPKPYVYIWITDARGAHVRTLAAWGNERKYIKGMREWWRIGMADADLVKAVTRATRVAGRYTLVWDGINQKGKAVPPGTYAVWLEVASEKLPYAVRAAKIVCQNAPANAKISESSAFNTSSVTYGPARKEA